MRNIIFSFIKRSAYTPCFVLVWRLIVKSVFCVHFFTITGRKRHDLFPFSGEKFFDSLFTSNPKHFQTVHCCAVNCSSIPLNHIFYFTCFSYWRADRNYFDTFLAFHLAFWQIFSPFLSKTYLFIYQMSNFRECLCEQLTRYFLYSHQK